MKEIERLRFAVQVGLANSFRAFLRNISNEPPVKELLASAKSRETAIQLLHKVLSLSKLRVDFRYLHRFDIALATYLWILSRTHPELATAGAEAAAYLPRTWWTEQVSRYILEELSKRSDSSTNVLVQLTAGILSTNTSNVAASTSRMLPDPLFGFAPAEKSIEVTTNTAETSVIQHADIGANANVAPSFDTVQSVVVTPAESQ